MMRKVWLLIMAKKNKIIIGVAAAVVVIAVGTGIFLNRDQLFSEKVDSDFSVSYDGIAAADISAGVSVHDPSIIKADGTYYIFGSHMSGASSTDLRNWEVVGDGYTPNNPIFDNLFATESVFDYSGSKNSGRRISFIMKRRDYIICIFVLLQPGTRQTYVMRLPKRRKVLILGKAL